MDTRLLVRLAVVAAAFSLFAVAPATAADEDCKSEVKAEGTPASLRDLGAYPNSLMAWRSAVKEKYGSEYNSWRYAKDRDVVCDEEDGKWICKRAAKPCKDVLHRMLDGAADRGQGELQGRPLQSYGAKKKSEKAARRKPRRAGRSTRARSTARNGRSGITPPTPTSTATSWAAAISASRSARPVCRSSADRSGTRRTNESGGREARPPLF